MLQINDLGEGSSLFKALGSEVRMKMVRLLSEQGEMNLNEIASALELTNGAVTSHIKKLEECGIIEVKNVHSARGMQKVCSLKVKEILLNCVTPEEEERNTKVYETEIRIGHYSDYSVKPGCGAAGREGMIGKEDDPRSFAYPERVEAQMLWLHDGYIEYRIPNLLPEKQRIVQVTLIFEISSAMQGLEEDPQSVIHFLLNGREIGNWLSVHSSDPSRGIYTPMWWNRQERQRGYLKMIVINNSGAYLDGVKAADVDWGWDFLDDQGEMKLRFEVRPENRYTGGLALYGAGFGNYRQDIIARVHYMPEGVWTTF